jgi:hypothetical protein
MQKILEPARSPVRNMINSQDLKQAMPKVDGTVQLNGLDGAVEV